MARLNLLSPWMTYYHEMVAFFKEDLEVNVVWDDSSDTDKIKLFVSNSVKADALSILLPAEKVFGVVTIAIEVIPSNEEYFNFKATDKMNDRQLFELVLTNNLAVSFIKTINEVFSSPLTYVVFKNEVVQYYTDSLGDYYGQCSTLYQDLAKNIFGEHEGIFFCTDKPSTSTITASTIMASTIPDCYNSSIKF